jgi:hypothetical protein
MAASLLRSGAVLAEYGKCLAGLYLSGFRALLSPVSRSVLGVIAPSNLSFTALADTTSGQSAPPLLSPAAQPPST